MKVAALFIFFVCIISSYAFQQQDEFVCKEKNDYNLDRFAVFPNLLQLDSTPAVEWTLSSEEALAKGSKIAGPSAIFSGDVWTGRTSFAGKFSDIGPNADHHIGLLLGVVSPRSKYIMIDWLGSEETGLKCESDVVSSGYSKRKAGIYVRAIDGPLGDTEQTQLCNVLSPINQENVVTVWKEITPSGARSNNVDYFFNVTINTFTDELFLIITEGEKVIVDETITPEGMHPVRNFSVGTVGPFVANADGKFFEMSVTPMSCEDNALANCGYDCPEHASSEITVEDASTIESDDDDDGLQWWGIILILMFICLICCCIGVVIAFIVVCVLGK